MEAQPFTLPMPVQVFDLPTAPNGVNCRLYVRAPLREPENGSARAASIFWMVRFCSRRRRR
ncbi:MAG: hypothetical protein R3C16_10230 [Hyphomonadaceae bacterium]